MNRTIGGIPIIGWVAALGAIVAGALYIKKKNSTTATPAASKTPPFTQAQEVQDFQVFSALTGAQQASDLNMVSELAGLFAGGSSPTSATGSGGGSGGGTSGGSGIPSPPSTGTPPPTTYPASQMSPYGLSSQLAADQATGLPAPTTGNPSGLPYGLSYISDAPNPAAPNGSYDPAYNPRTGV
jgi:hypothetical protein